MATPVANPLPEKGDVELTQDLVQQDARPDDTLRGPINSSRSGTKKEKVYTFSICVVDTTIHQ